LLFVLLAALLGGGLPECVTEMSTPSGGRVLRWVTCGGEGPTAGEVVHHAECPETDGGTATDGEEVSAHDDEVLRDSRDESVRDGRAWSGHAPTWRGRTVVLAVKAVRKPVGKRSTTALGEGGGV